MSEDFWRGKRKRKKKAKADDIRVLAITRGINVRGPGKMHENKSE